MSKNTTLNNSITKEVILYKRHFKVTCVSYVGKIIIIKKIFKKTKIQIHYWKIIATKTAAYEFLLRVFKMNNEKEI